MLRHRCLQGKLNAMPTNPKSPTLNAKLIALPDTPHQLYTKLVSVATSAAWMAWGTRLWRNIIGSWLRLVSLAVALR